VAEVVRAAAQPPLLQAVDRGQPSLPFERSRVRSADLVRSTAALEDQPVLKSEVRGVPVVGGKDLVSRLRKAARVLSPSDVERPWPYRHAPAAGVSRAMLGGNAMTNERIPSGKGSEAPVEAAFKRWLESEGWRVIAEAGSWADVIAERGDERLIGEVKGHTSSTGLDIDTMFGQLLRRMKPGAATTWALIVPTRSLTAVLRVPLDVRQRIGIRVFEVRDDDSVTEHFA
jgi:hypothetical protein